jgi:hypothetical protein
MYEVAVLNVLVHADHSPRKRAIPTAGFQLLLINVVITSYSPSQSFTMIVTLKPT